MSPYARLHCTAAMELIKHGHYGHAIDNLRLAIKGTSDRRAWSKLMLAIRELQRVA